MANFFSRRRPPPKSLTSTLLSVQSKGNALLVSARQLYFNSKPGLSKTRTITMIDGPTGQIQAEDLDYKTVREDWNIYELEDETRLKVKLVVAKISRGLDPKTNKPYFLPNGEPLYNVR